jgi:hypothetical protein
MLTLKLSSETNSTAALSDREVERIYNEIKELRNGGKPRVRTTESGGTYVEPLDVIMSSEKDRKTGVAKEEK